LPIKESNETKTVMLLWFSHMRSPLFAYPKKEKQRRNHYVIVTQPGENN